MSNGFANWLIKKFSRWLLQEEPCPYRGNFSDFDQVCLQIKPGDILLFEGHSRISTIIGYVTQSVWTHSALYIGRLNEIEDDSLRDKVKQYAGNQLEEQFLIETEIGFGTVITPLIQYKNEHTRLLRPTALTAADAKKVCAYAINRLGIQYDLRHLFDLARLLFPWGLYPRRWRSSLFQHNALQPTKDICSSMIAESFESVDYPILPLIENDDHNQLEFIRRNNTLYTPSDFDFSPYFDVLKYPFYPLNGAGAYHHLPWVKNVVSDDEGMKKTYLPQQD